MCGILGPSAGESWLAYVGVPDNYPQLGELSRDIDDAMWEAAQEVLRDRVGQDPLLRVLADDRCGLWETHPRRAGDLPPGIRFSIERAGQYGRAMRAYGCTRPLNRYELEDAERFPEHHADQVGFDWNSYSGEWPSWGWPTITRDTEVVATVPIPFDLSALLAVIDAEQNTPTPPPAPRRRAPAQKRARRARAR